MNRSATAKKRPATSPFAETGLMKPGALRTPDGGMIPVRIAVREDNLLLECSDVALLLRHLYGTPLSMTFPEGAYVRGVVFGGEGCVLQVFDRLGCITDELPLLDERDVRRLIWGALIAEA